MGVPVAMKKAKMVSISSRKPSLIFVEGKMIVGCLWVTDALQELFGKHLESAMRHSCSRIGSVLAALRYS